MIDKTTEGIMNGDNPTRPKRRAEAPRSTAELLCLLATYEAYGTGLGWSGCLRTLAERGGKR